MGREWPLVFLTGLADQSLSAAMASDFLEVMLNFAKVWAMPPWDFAAPSSKAQAGPWLSFIFRNPTSEPDFAQSMPKWTSIPEKSFKTRANQVCKFNSPRTSTP